MRAGRTACSPGDAVSICCFLLLMRARVVIPFSLVLFFCGVMAWWSSQRKDAAAPPKSAAPAEVAGVAPPGLGGPLPRFAEAASAEPEAPQAPPVVSRLTALAELLRRLPMRDTDDPAYHPRRDAELRHLLAELSAAEFPGAIAVMEQLSRQVPNNHDMSLVFEAWGSTDPNVALNCALKKQPVKTLVWDVEYATRMVTGAWLKSDPSGAMAGIRRRLEAPSVIEEEAPILDPNNSHVPPDEREWLLGFAMPHLLQQDAAGTVDWALSLKDERVRTMALQTAIQSGSQAGSPVLAAVERWLESRSYQDGDFPVIFAHMQASMSAQPAETLSSIVSNTQMGDQMRSHLMQEALHSWTANDGEAASAWLAEQTNVPHLDEALTGLVSAGLSQDDAPAVLMTWAALIRDASVRTRLHEQILGQWQNQDPRAASAWKLSRPARP